MCVDVRGGVAVLVPAGLRLRLTVDQHNGHARGGMCVGMRADMRADVCIEKKGMCRFDPVGLK